LRARQHRRETLLTTDMVLGGTKKAKDFVPRNCPREALRCTQPLAPNSHLQLHRNLMYCRASIQSRASQHRELLQRRNTASCCSAVASSLAAPGAAAASQQPVQRRSNTSCSDAAPQRCALQRCCELQRHSRSLQHRALQCRSVARTRAAAPQQHELQRHNTVVVDANPKT